MSRKIKLRLILSICFFLSPSKVSVAINILEHSFKVEVKKVTLHSFWSTLYKTSQGFAHPCLNWVLRKWSKNIRKDYRKVAKNKVKNVYSEREEKKFEQWLDKGRN